MSSSGSGIGGSIGGPTQPSPREIETSAWTTVNKAALSLVKDTLEIPFSQLGGNIWQYEADSNRPSLKSLSHNRTSHPDDDTLDDTWKIFFKQLVAKLDPPIKEGLTIDRHQPSPLRDTLYVSLEKMLTSVAKGLAWLRKRQVAFSSHSPQGERFQENRELPFAILQAVIEQNVTILSSLASFLKFRGANYTHYDDLSHFLNELRLLNTSLSQLATFSLQMQNLQQKIELNRIASQLHLLEQQLHQTYHGHEMQILYPLIQNMSAIASALSTIPCSPSLFLGLKMASLAIFKSDSQLGLIGKELEKWSQMLSMTLLDSFMLTAGTGKQMMLVLSLILTFLSSGILAAYLAEKKSESSLETNQNAVQADPNFTIQLLFSFFGQSALIQTIYEFIVASCGGNKEEQVILAILLEWVTLIHMALISHQGKIQEAATALANLKEHVKAGFQQLTSCLAKITSVKNKLLPPVFTQILLAIEQDKWEVVIKLYLDTLTEKGLNPSLLLKELEITHYLTKLLQTYCIPEKKSQSNTLIRAA